MKKAFVFFVLSLFMASVAVIAEDNSTSSEPVLISEQVTEYSTDNNDVETETEDANGSVETTDRSTEGIKNAVERYVHAKEQYAEAKTKYVDAKEQFIELRGELTKCKDDNSTKCLDLRAEIQDKAKEHLGNMVDIILRSLEKVKAKVEANQDITPEEADALLAEINAKIAAMTDAKDALNISEDREEILNATKKIKEEWEGTKPILRGAAERVVNERIGGIIVASERLEAKLNKTVERMASKGADTSAASELIAKFSAEIESAKANYESAKAKINDAAGKDAKEAHDLLVEGHKDMKAAHQDLKDARVILKDILNQLRDNVKEVNSDKVKEVKGNETKDDKNELNKKGKPVKEDKDVNDSEVEDSVDEEDINETSSSENETEVNETEED